MCIRRHVLGAVLLVIGCLALPVALLAQADTGVIDGRVLDESKSAVPAATVTARNIATGFTRTVVSSDQGTYRLEFLPPGRYEYKFVIDGKWKIDPRAHQFSPNSFGTLNSVIEVKA